MAETSLFRETDTSVLLEMMDYLSACFNILANKISLAEKEHHRDELTVRAQAASFNVPQSTSQAEAAYKAKEYRWFIEALNLKHLKPSAEDAKHEELFSSHYDIAAIALDIVMKELEDPRRASDEVHEKLQKVQQDFEGDREYIADHGMESMLENIEKI